MSSLKSMSQFDSVSSIASLIDKQVLHFENLTLAASHDKDQDSFAFSQPVRLRLAHVETHTHTHTCTHSLLHTLTHSFTPCLRTGQRAFKMLTKDPCLHTCMLSFCSDTLKWPRVSEGSFSIPLTLCLSLSLSNSRTHRLTARSLSQLILTHTHFLYDDVGAPGWYIAYKVVGGLHCLRPFRRA